MLDMIDCSFLVFFLTPSQGSWILLCREFNNIVFSSGRERREPGYEDASVPADKACSHPTLERVKVRQVLSVAYSEGLTEQGSAQQDLN